MPRRKIETLVVHAGERPRRPGEPVVEPIYQSAMAVERPGAAYDDLGYLRLSNSPSHHAVQGKLAALEGGEAALVTSSGMAAISTTLLEILGPGGHLLAHDTLYGGTLALLREDLPRFGLAATPIDGGDPDRWRSALRPETRAIYVEAITNPLLRVPDLEAVVAFTREHGLLSVIDATFATPVNFRPLELGFDLVVHSATKYLNGHSDLVAGCVVGSAALVDRIRHRSTHLGGALDPHACYLLQRGLKTLSVRVRRQNETAHVVAARLATRSCVEAVHYPGLPSHPDHDRVGRLFDGFGGMIAIDLGSAEVAERMLGRLELVVPTFSLGGVESLATRPAASSHASLPRAAREALGIGEGLVRLSIGLEAPDDLLADFDQALGD